MRTKSLAATREVSIKPVSGRVLKKRESSDDSGAASLLQGSRHPLRPANSIFADSNSAESRNRSLAARLSVLATRSAFERGQIGNGSLGHLSCMRSDGFLTKRIPQFESQQMLSDAADFLDRYLRS